MVVGASAYVSISQYKSAYVSISHWKMGKMRGGRCVSFRQHTSAYVEVLRLLVKHHNFFKKCKIALFNKTMSIDVHSPYRRQPKHSWLNYKHA